MDRNTTPSSLGWEDACSQASLGRLLERAKRAPDPIPTPLPKWNHSCRQRGGRQGFARGWYVIVAGNTGFGKSNVALNVVAKALRAGHRVSYLTLEMARDDLMARLAAIYTRQPIELIEMGPMQSREVLESAYASMAGARLRWNISQRSDVDAILRDLKDEKEGGADLIVVDYVQLVRQLGEADLLKQTTIVSNYAREIAHDGESTAVLALSQYNRETSKNYQSSPTPQSLFGGSPLENDSDQVLLLDHSRYEKHQPSATADTYLILGKNRYGPTGEIRVRWDYHTLRLEELAV